MLKYKRYNASEISKNVDVNYSYIDLIRQTALKVIVDMNKNMSKKDLIEMLKDSVIDYLLNQAIEEN